MRLIKHHDNPILIPCPDHEWESLVTTNPAAWYDEEHGRVMLLYRAAGKDAQHRVHLGLATSTNGYDFVRTNDLPVLSPLEDGWDSGTVEDPRIVKFGEHYFITYASVPYRPGRYWEVNGSRQLPGDVPPEAPVALRENKTRTGLAITKDFKTIRRVGYLTDPVLDDRDVMIFPEKVGCKFVTLHRPIEWVGEEFGCEQASIWIAFSDDLLEHKRPRLLAKPQYPWEMNKIGGAAPPIRTYAGWLTLYHGVDEKGRYSVGAMLLDLNDPSIVLCRTPEPIMVPEHSYEEEGLYKGICFPCGNVVIDDTLFVYYGGADQFVGVATCSLTLLLDHLGRFKQ